MHLSAKANSLSVQTFMANKSHSDSDSDQTNLNPQGRNSQEKIQETFGAVVQ